MPKHFEVGAPMRQTIRNSRDEDEMNQAVELLAEKLAPAVAELLSKGETSRETATNGRADDDWDTLPDGDDAPARGGDHFDNLPTD